VGFPLPSQQLLRLSLRCKRWPPLSAVIAMPYVQLLSSENSAHAEQQSIHTSGYQYVKSLRSDPSTTSVFATAVQIAMLGQDWLLDLLLVFWCNRCEILAEGKKSNAYDDGPCSNPVEYTAHCYIRYTIQQTTQKVSVPTPSNSL
jgi:hypothetical protein